MSKLVGRMYEAFPYPPPTYDLEQAIADGGYQVGDPTFWAPLLWPEGRPGGTLKILVAGCGTTQAAWFAFTNRNCNVVGVDLSQESLAHARYLQDKHDLQNLRLFRGDLREIEDLGERFDLVICTGVLHHMADPNDGMRALANVMQPSAALACMLYGATLRTGVYMVQDVFRRLGVTADADGVVFARQILASLPDWHFVRTYIRQAGELQHDAALADTFLHPQDRAYTVPQLLELVEGAGLHFQGWLDNSTYYPEGVAWLPAELAERIASLPPREQWAAMEMINPALSTHYFFVRKAPPPSLSFEQPDMLVPSHRPGLRRTGPHQYSRAGRVFTLTADDAALFEEADGARSVLDLGDAHGLFERLWKQGHVLLSLRSPPS
ncbi:MAG: methyltransferase domain-containing protein [Vitreimonas sp.]